MPRRSAEIRPSAPSATPRRKPRAEPAAPASAPPSVVDPRQCWLPFLDEPANDVLALPGST